MSNAAAQPHGIMEGKGAYNQHAKLPAGGAALAMPLLEKAVQGIELDASEQPLLIADYGSSQGKNSMAPMHFAIRGLRRRVGPHRAIFVSHIDQPSNDFATLFSVLDSDPDRYVLDEPNVFPAAIGRSFYENVLPPALFISDGPRTPRCGSAEFQHSFPATSFLLTVRARCAPNSTARAHRTGKPSFLYGQKNYAQVDA